MKFNRPERKLEPVKSSTIQAIGFDGPKEELVVEFKGGAQYLYKKVGKMTFDSFKTAESQGKYFHANIKGKFEFTKIKEGMPKPKKGEEK